MSAEAVAALFAGLAVVIAFGAFLRGELNARAHKVDAREARKAADEANQAAHRSAAALERMADQWAESLSRAEKRDQRQWSERRSGRPMGFETRGGPWAGMPPAGPAQPVVHWTVDKVKGGLHTLTNLGQATAYDVTLSSENAIRFDAPEPRTVEMGEAVEFRAFGSWQTGTPELVVTWRDTPNGEVRSWTRPLP